MKVKIIECYDRYELEDEINDFIYDYKVIDIKYAVTTIGFGTYYSALIMYDFVE